MNANERLKELLRDGNPNYIFPFFWQHGEEEAVLREYMRAIRQSNIGAVCVESRPHPDFACPRWWRDMDVILDEAKRLDMKVWILDDEHFPTGYAAGAVENAPPELCHQYLDYNTADVCGPKPQVELNVERLAHPRPAPPWMPQMPAPKRVFGDDRLYRVLACPVEAGGTMGKSLDLTDFVHNGTLVWDVPAGYYRLFVLYLTRDARGRNDYINFLDKTSCRLLIDAVYEPHYARYGELFGSVIAGFFSDEPPIGNTPGYTRGDLIGRPDMPLPWSAAMPGRLAEEYGGKWEDMLPYLWTGGERHATARIRTAYMNAVSKLVEECFSQQLGTWCREHGVEYIGHMLEDCDSSANLGPSMGHFFRGLSGQHMAGIDNIGGQVLIGGQNIPRRMGDGDLDTAGFYHYTLGRMGASAAAIEPRKQGRCLCENYGAYGWQTGVRMMKYLTDHFLARGVNRYVPHAFTPKDFPDPDCPPHFYAHGLNPQYRAFGELMKYTNRVCHLIDGGQVCAPVALLYHGESQWAGGYESNILACRELTTHQFGFVMIPADVFAKPADYNTTFSGGKLRVNGIEFGALVVSGCEFLPRSAAQFAGDAHEAGFPVVFTNRLPAGVGDADAEESRYLTGRLADCTVTEVTKLAEALDRFVPRDAALPFPFRNLTVYHYKNGCDVYLFLNEDPVERFSGEVTIEATGEAVAYDAWRGAVLPVCHRAEGKNTVLSLDLAPLELLVVLVGGSLPRPGIMRSYDGAAELLLDDFTVSRAEAETYPEFHSPEPANLQSGMGCKYPEFSGFYRYETEVALSNPGKGLLEIADAYECAEVFVNDVSAGMVAAPPYRFELDGLLRDGKNQIAIEVATTLERHMAAQGVDTACMSLPAPLSPTGIVGAVTLKINKED